MSAPDNPAPKREADSDTRGSAGSRKSLRHTTARGFVWSFGSAGGQALLQIISLAVLGRLLIPADFGLVAAAMLVVGFTTTIGQLGVSAALVQKPGLTAEQTGAGIVVSVLTSLVLSVGVWFAVPLLTPLLGLPADSTALRLLVVVIPLTGIGAVPLGLMQRELRFRGLAAVDLSAYAIGIALSIILAVVGFGAFSLVWGQIATVVLQSAGYWRLATVRVRFAGLRELTRAGTELLGFGLPYSIGQVGNWIAGNGDNFVVATQLNAASLGVYSRAFQLLAAPANLIGGVADRVLFPAMSAVQHDKLRMMRAYVTSSVFVAMLTVPASVILFSGAPDLVHILLGTRWDPVIAPLQVFSLVLLPRASYKISGSFTRARGAVRGGAVRQWLYAFEVVVACFVGSHWGVTGVAIGASIAMVLHYLVMIHFSSQVAPGLWRALGTAYLRYIPLLAGCLLADFIALFAMSGVELPILRLAIIAVSVVLVGAGVIVLLRRAFSDELSLVRTILLRRQPADGDAAAQLSGGALPDGTVVDTPGKPGRKRRPSA